MSRSAPWDRRPSSSPRSQGPPIPASLQGTGRCCRCGPRRGSGRAGGGPVRRSRCAAGEPTAGGGRSPPCCGVGKWGASWGTPPQRTPPVGTLMDPQECPRGVSCDFLVRRETPQRFPHPTEPQRDPPVQPPPLPPGLLTSPGFSPAVQAPGQPPTAGQPACFSSGDPGIQECPAPLLWGPRHLGSTIPSPSPTKGPCSPYAGVAQGLLCVVVDKVHPLELRGHRAL